MMALHEYGIDGFFSSNTTYFTYVRHEVGAFSTMWIDVSGRWMWQKWIESTQEWSIFSFMPRDPCEVYVNCGPFDTCSTHIISYCGCLPGFEPTSMADWSLGDTSRGMQQEDSIAVWQQQLGRRWAGRVPQAIQCPDADKPDLSYDIECPRV
ncbi:hypothetical protein Taro_038375 [Colocasia esculenta]|uniref:S-locus glycoprotein domain-containing protein n=1 Tax=Colocasia esculenta TaxID=4460 RepID=A0A843WFP4_COLES|nr:hypothetical protein [Colocasia esculenta]